MKKLLRLCICFVFVLTATYAFSQNIKKINLGMTEVSRADLLGLGDIQFNTVNGRIYELDIAALKADLIGISHRDVAQSGFVAELNFPHPDGTRHMYYARENSTLDPALVALFNIHSYDANGTDGAFVKWDITEHGFHAMIRKAGESTIFIDPVIKGNTQYYIVYYKNDFSTDKVMDCSFGGSDVLDNPVTPVNGSAAMFGTCELRTYRLALTATGEYTSFHGGTVAGAQAAQVTTMNRVNGIYEKDLAITMTIIANNNLIIYTNSGTDPFSNGNPGSMISQNQSNTDAVIGNGNYDIGHVFGTNSGGLAGLGVVCSNSSKARGVTGSSAPIGDPFDIDYVAHEMGHQFGADHTFNNSCGGNRNNSTAFEPGSGSTIMAYAGICPSNVQNNSDDHFHGGSLEQIGTYIQTRTCQVTTSLPNNAPTLVSTNGGSVVPSGTPFALTAVATDLDGDPMTYNWEQMNNGISTQPPVATSTIGPNFRSSPSTTSPTRYFPNLADLTIGGPFTWEVLPTVSRVMDFRVTLRDNAPGPGGCNDHMDVTVTVDENSGPFIVNYPSSSGITWAGATSETVTWDVAGTNVAPVNCTNVNILLSTDGGLTYPTSLAADVPNDGSQIINVPSISTTTARVMVICSSGTFFDISNNDFEISTPSDDYSLSSLTPMVSVCQPTDALFTIDIGSIGGYNDPVALSVSGVPAGATSVFSTNPVTPAGTSTLTISSIGLASTGAYVLTVQGVSTSGTKTTELDLNISNNSSLAPTLTSPLNLAVSVSNPIDFAWVAMTGVTYDIDIATDAGFGNIVDQAIGLVSAAYNSTGLLGGANYFWRVRSVTGCGSSPSPSSATWSFTTNTCSVYASADVGQTTDVASVTSVINVLTTGTVADISVPLFDLSHTWLGDVSAELMSPTGTVVSLFDRPGYSGTGWGCNEDDINVSFDDGAASTATDLEGMCAGTAPSITGAFQSIDPLSGFDGESITGAWTLTLYDAFTASDVGELNAWSLELCTVTPCVETTSSFSVTDCYSYTVPSGNATYPTTGVYNDTIPNVAGCDSVMTISVTIVEAPTITGFSNKSYHGNTVEWSMGPAPLENGDRYVIRYHEFMNSPNFLYRTLPIVYNTAYVNGLEANTRYVYRVGYRCAGEPAAIYSDTMSVTTKCSNPLNLNSIRTGTSAVLSWDDVNSTSYKVRYRPVGASTWSYRNVPGPAIGTTITGLSLVPYEWQIRSICDLRSLSYSPLQSIDIGAGRLAKTEEESFMIFPNPVIDLLTLRSSKQVLKVTIYDATGKVVMRENAATFSVVGLQSGVYSLHVLTDSQFQSGRFVKK
jgi:subtilisin-like proprotein convertase family protein